MPIVFSLLRRAPTQMFAKLLLATSVMAGAAQVMAAPVVERITGALDHAGVVTVTGTGFGTKATAAPLERTTRPWANWEA